MQITEHWHAVPAAEVCAKCASRASGLNEEEAAERSRGHGPNELPHAPIRSRAAVFLSQFSSPLIYLLIFAAGVATLIGERRDGLVIMAVVLINAVVGAWQEGRAQRSMDALRRLARSEVRVRRGGVEHLVSARDLVPGDVLVLAAGDVVGADARVVECAGLAAAEAALTGESVPVAKQAAALPRETPLTGRANMVYSGTHVTAGRGRAVVVATGRATEVGKIAGLTATAREPPTPLEQRMAGLGRQLVTVAIALCLLIMGVGWWRGIPLNDLLMVTISQMVSLVPEGLPVAMTIALAVGMQRMARRRAIIRRLRAVETLGSTSIICTDKTGTLTKNEMTVTAVWLADRRRLGVTGSGYQPEGRLVEFGNRGAAVKPDDDLRALLEAGVLCNDARLVPPDEADPRWRALGDPTEAALLTLAGKGGVDAGRLQNEWPRRAEIPFDPAAKLMVTGHSHAQRPGRVILKGAPELIVAMCLAGKSGGAVPEFDESRQRAALDVAREFGDLGLRVLAFAEVPDVDPAEALTIDSLAGRAILLGMTGQMDPPREEVLPAVARCAQAGIRAVLVTGDHPATALSMARLLGIARDGDRTVDGTELEAMPEQDLRAGLDRMAVFARVHPAQKLRIVEAFQAEGHVVAMTGDGVNDAPALARADVGVAMGMSGTEVAKNAAKVVIVDDNFATIIQAVEQGRLVYANIQKLLLFLLTTSVDEVILLLGALVLGYPLPLLAVQILWINLVTEGALTINLVMEDAEGDEMRRPPIKSDAPLITPGMWLRMAVMVPASVVATFGFFLWRLSTGVSMELVRTETFTMLAVCQWFNVLNCESATRSVFRLGLWRNKWLLTGLVVANILQVAVVYWPPLNRLFHTVPIPLGDFFLIGAVASLVLWSEEFRKYFARLVAPKGSQDEGARRRALAGSP